MMEKQLSRRKFLKTGCIAAGALGLTMCGGGALAASYRPKIELPASIVNENGNGSHTLVAYATRAGSTAETAARMAEVLAANNQPVDLLPVKEVNDISRYHTVILGSAVRIGQLLPEAMSFVETYQTQLSQKVFNVFLLCMTLETDNTENRGTVSAYLEPLRSLVKPTHEGLFAGVINLSRLNLLDRLMSTAMKTPVGDYRKWDEINSWVNNSSK
jgi:menaquinone-dependent protoporphyrinogen oxidase